LADRRGTIIRHHQRSASSFLRRWSLLWQRIAPWLSGMTGIDLPRVRDKTGIDRRRPSAGLRSEDSNRSGRCEHGGQDDEDRAFHGSLLWLGSRITPKGPSKLGAPTNIAVFMTLFLRDFL
jgi:hypothetical protein